MILDTDIYIYEALAIKILQNGWFKQYKAKFH